MLFTLEALDAKHGDSLILHYGEKADPKFILVDGGPSGVYKNRLKKRLLEIKKQFYPQKALPLELVMLSHLDADHITGLVDLTDEMVSLKKKSKELSFDIYLLWYNTFDKILGNNEVNLQNSFLASSSNQMMFNLLRTKISEHSNLMLASVSQGIALDLNADELDISVNQGFKKLIGATKTGKKIVDLGDDLIITVVWPNQESLTNLQDEWDKEIKKLVKKKKLEPTEMITLAAYLDKSVYNLSSIVCLIECKGKTILLTGDARGDCILKGLEDADKLKKGSDIKFDILKLPHHGSNRDVTQDFFKRIKADYYIISADGKYGNPDIDTLEMLSSARGNDKYSICLTNRTGKDNLEDKLDKFFKSSKQSKKKYKVFYRKQTEHSLKIDLLEAS
jgi:beta-lactamase superfamily II metal-dependent hydrolase